jgi:hypothetical protein
MLVFFFICAQKFLLAGYPMRDSQQQQVKLIILY